MISRSKRDLPPIRLSQRSNGLVFSQHYFATSASYGSYPTAFATCPKRVLSTALSRISEHENAGSKSRTSNKKAGVTAADVTSTAKLRVSSSLIPPTVQTVPKPAKEGAISNSKVARNLSASAASIRSFTSSVLSRKRKYVSLAKLDALPAEILDEIFAYLPQQALHSLLLTNTQLVDAAAIAMYRRPKFASTYRFAQFVSTVSHGKHYADMVRELDLNSFGGRKNDMDENKPLAGWREWKYRSEPLYSIQHDVNNGFRPRLGRESGDRSAMPTSTHPNPNPFLKTWATCRDVPMGAIIHVLEACQRIQYVLFEGMHYVYLLAKYCRKIDMSYLSLAADYAILPSSKAPTAFTKLIFVSDVPKSWTWRTTEIQSISGTNIVESIVKLPQLESIRIKKGVWLSTDLITTLVRRCPKLETVNFKGSGMAQGMKWAIKGSRDELRQILMV